MKQENMELKEVIFLFPEELENILITNLGMRGDQCKEICPDFHTFFVQEKRGKANLTK